jgi:hypothetical protein
MGSSMPFKKDDTESWTLPGLLAPWLEKVPHDKLVMGLASYGRSFTLANPKQTGLGAPATGGGKALPGTTEAGLMGYFEILDFIKSGATVAYDKDALVPYAFKGDQWVGYDDPNSIRHKVDYALQLGMAGTMWWEVGTDDFNNCSPLVSTAFDALSDAAKRSTKTTITITTPPPEKPEPKPTKKPEPTTPKKPEPTTPKKPEPTPPKKPEPKSTSTAPLRCPTGRPNCRCGTIVTKMANGCSKYQCKRCAATPKKTEILRTSCVSLYPCHRAGTASCTDFLAYAAKQLGIQVNVIVSFGVEGNKGEGKPAMCTRGHDGTFATAQNNGLWAGVQYRVCAAYVKAPCKRRYLRGN